MHEATAPQEKSVICASCDIGCQLTAEVRDGRVTRVRASNNPLMRDNICMKGIYAPKSFAHPDRVRYPLRRVGARGGGQWERVTWDAALDDIAARLQRVIATHGPEAMAVATSQWNTSTETGAGRRLMNLLGSPNWISGVALCAGNTAAVNRMVYGWFPQPDYSATRCIVLFGHNPKRHSWTPIYNAIRRAQERGATLIVLDPRRSESAERADLWLPLRAGSDAAMCLGWLKVIFDEQLYDAAFVRDWTVGFDDLRRRVDEYPLERVAALTGVAPEQIRAAARLYATHGPSVIPWTPITDQQRNSTSAIRLHCALRAVTGNLYVPGGELFHGLSPDIVPETDLELHEQLSEAQKAKQLGCDNHPAFTYRGMAALTEPTRRVWGRPYVNLLMGSYMANPSAVFRAMADGVPYPVKAFFSLGNNTLLGFADMRTIYRGIMNQDLVVVHEHMMTPTAQLADYVLPGDSWLERPQLHDAWGWTAIVRVSEQAMQPPGECRGVYDFWRSLAVRMGLGAHFPWPNLEAVYDHRVRATGMRYRDFEATYEWYVPTIAYRKYERTGFATPSGKVELASSVLAALGFDPLPYFREDPPADPDYPLQLFMGVREDEYFQTGHRHIPELRQRRPEPELFLHADDARDCGLAHGDWAVVETPTGRVKGKVAIRPDMPRRLVRVPHGWWKPELPQGAEHLSGAWEFADAQITRDDEDYRDREQGIPHLKGLPCRVRPLAAAEAP
ncbi:MAG: molybdopterin-dependent oxidoreductase [Deltaproteobacteria bacterium]|nr:molybdopterin-dependent oxidoreductase [Deltaproteobacteria bacterium]